MGRDITSVILLFAFYTPYSFFGIPYSLHYCHLLCLVDFSVVKYLRLFLISFCMHSIAMVFVVILGFAFNILKL